MKIIAITGRSGSGKSTVRGHYAALGYPVVDADAIARSITQKGSAVLAKLAETFGGDIVCDDGSLNRALLAQRAFSSDAQRAALNDITHPAIVEGILAELSAARAASFAFVDGAAIVGEMFEPYCDAIIAVFAPEGNAVKRIVARDGISKEDALRRLGAQTSEQVLRKAAHYCIENNGTQEDLIRQAEAVLAQLEQKYQNKK